MPINTGLGQVSNAALVSAIALYALAMVAYAGDLAFGRRRTGRQPQARAPELVAATVAAGSAEAAGQPGAQATGLAIPADPAGLSEPADPDGADDADAAQPAAAARPARPGSGPRWPSGTWLRSAFLLTCVGLLSQIAALAIRGVAEHRVPWGNMYEFIAAITCAAVLVLVLAAIRFRAYYTGLFVLLPVVLALAVDVVVIYTPAEQLVPALKSYWIAIHVTAMIIGIGMYLFGAVVTVLFLLSARSERLAAAGQGSRVGGIMAQLPGSATLDRLSYRSILFAFPAWTFAVIAGAIWADQAWGRYWGWDPKETWSFITWLVYASFLHARATAGWRGKRAAFIHLTGFACLMFNLVGVNLWITGLHSYAGIN